LEFELADKHDPIITPFAYNAASTWNDTITTANTTDRWLIQNACTKCDIVTLDNALDNSSVKHLLSGKSLNIVYKSFISSLQTLVAADTQVNVSRSLSKMKSMFMSLDRDFTDGSDRKTFYNKQFRE
jgi:hypothetical protein